MTVRQDRRPVPEAAADRIRERRRARLRRAFPGVDIDGAGMRIPMMPAGHSD